MLRVKTSFYRQKKRIIASFLLLIIVCSILILTLKPPDKVSAAVSRTGSLTEIDDRNDSSSQSVSVPSDATLAVVAVSGFQSTVNKFSGGTVTLGGSTMTAVSSGQDGTTSRFMGAMFYLVNPPTGTQTLAWDWLGSTNPTDGVVLVHGYYKGNATVSMARDTDGVQGAATSYSTKSLTATTGDLIIAWGHLFKTTSLTYSWTNATKVADFQTTTSFQNAGGSWAEGSPSGNTSVTFSHSGTTANDGGVGALVVKSGQNAPAAPTLSSPANSATGVSLIPQLQLSTTDTSNDYLRYEVQICSTSNCSSVVRTVCQDSNLPNSCTGSQTGWSGQDQQTATPTPVTLH
jgi:hypothetical protein